MPTRKKATAKKAAAKKATAKKAAKKSAATKKAAGPHARGETMPWKIWVEEHAERHNSPTYVKSRKTMNRLAREVVDMYYGQPDYEDHHGGGLWVKDEEGWFIVRNLVGMEWSSQFCADPAKVDQLRVNARRLYARFPEAVAELKIRELLDTPITDSDGVARWTDSICNASLPLPKGLHTGTLPKPGKKIEPGTVISGGFHHYPAPIVDQQLFKYDDFELWVTEQDEPVAVVPIAPRGSGDGRTAVIFAAPGTPTADKKEKAEAKGEALILDEDDQLSLRAFNNQYAKVAKGDIAEGDPLSNFAEARAARPKMRRVAAKKYGL